MTKSSLFQQKGVIVHNKNNEITVIMITTKKIYASMARISDNEESTSRDIDDSSQLTNWILDVEAMCHITSQV